MNEAVSESNISITANPSRLKGSLTGFLLLVALGVELYFLLHDVTGEDQPMPEAPAAPPIAELVSLQNVVRLQQPGSLVWDDVHPGQTLYRKQSLLTSDQSKAEIAFLDGTGIVLDQDSMIEIEKAPADSSFGYQRLVVKLLRGTLYKSSPRKTSELPRKMAASTPEFDIQVGANILHPTPDSELAVSTTSERPGQASIVVRAGDVSVQNGAAAATVHSGESAEIRAAPNSQDAQGGSLVSSREMGFTLLSPASQETVTLATESPVINFRWNVIPSISSSAMRLEISQDARFEKGVKSVRIPPSEPPMRFLEASAELPAPDAETGAAGLWYWRVKSDDPSVAPSLTESFWVTEPPRPELSFPGPRAVAKTGADIDLTWDPMPQATSYEVELDSGGAQGSQNAQNTKTISTQRSLYTLSDLEKGTLHWRVRAHLSSGETTRWSETRELDVRAEDNPPPPELLDPEWEKKATPPPIAPIVTPRTPQPGPRQSWLDWVLPRAYADDDEMPTDDSIKIHLRWKRVRGVHRYKVQVSKTRAFTDLLAEAESGDPAWTWTYRPGMENSKGRVFYRVASINDDGVMGRFSQPKAIQLRDEATGATLPQDEDEGLPAKEGNPAPWVKSVQRLVLEPGAATKRRSAAPTAAPSPSPSTRPAFSAASAAGSTKPRWMISPEVGFGDLSQSSSVSDFSSVHLQSLYLHEQLRLTYENEAEHWAAQALLGFESFASAASQAALGQPVMNAMTAQIDGHSLSGPDAQGTEHGFGIRIERNFRFDKINPDTLDADFGISAGPMAMIRRRFGISDPGANGLREIGADVALPITGAITGDFIGIEGDLWAEWKVAGFGSGYLGFRPSAEFSYNHWSSPSGTQVVSWSIWFAPTFHF